MWIRGLFWVPGPPTTTFEGRQARDLRCGWGVWGRGRFGVFLGKVLIDGSVNGTIAYRIREGIRLVFLKEERTWV